MLSAHCLSFVVIVCHLLREVLWGEPFPSSFLRALRRIPLFFSILSLSCSLYSRIVGRECSIPAGAQQPRVCSDGV